MKNKVTDIPNKFIYTTGLVAAVLFLPLWYFAPISKQPKDLHYGSEAARNPASIGDLHSGLSSHSLSSAPELIADGHFGRIKNENILVGGVPSTEKKGLGGHIDLGGSLAIDISCQTGSRLEEDINFGMISSSFMQISGRNCLKRKLAVATDQELTIKNETNGFEATVFQKNNGSDEYQTDLIQLSSGENIIKVNYKNENGQTHSKRIIVLSGSKN